MPLGYPIANSAKAALETSDVVRTLAQANELTGKPVELVSDWLTPTAEQAETWKKLIQTGRDNGFVQVYEAADGKLKLAIAYWKPLSRKAAKIQKVESEKTRVKEEKTDDLYFTKPARTRPALRSRRVSNPNQLDLFGGKDPTKD